MTHYSIRKQRKEKFFRDKKCWGCGTSKKLQLHHVNPDTKTGVGSDIWGFSEARREVELAKCLEVCVICHIKLFHHEYTSGPKHGTISMYMKRDCRCKECVSANRKYQREWAREKRKKQKAMLLSKQGS